MAPGEWIDKTLHFAYKRTRVRWYQCIIELERNADRIVVFKRSKGVFEVVMKSEGGNNDPTDKFA